MDRDFFGSQRSVARTTCLILVGAVLGNSEMTFDQRMSGLAAMAASILFVAAGRLNYRVFPVIRARGLRAAVIFISGGVPLIIWSGIVARFFLTGHEFPFGQWLTTLLWASCPALGAFLGLMWGIETAARKRVAMAGS
jgi:hypothetical protein